MSNDVIQGAAQSSLHTNDWVLIGTTLFLGIIALIVPWLSELIKRHLFSPSLEINFEQKPPDCHLTRNKAITPEGEILRDEPIFYFRFRVSNSGKTQAKKCEVVLEQLYQADAAGNFKPFERYSPINIVWGSFQGEFVDINPNRIYFCDLFHIPSKDDQKLLLSRGHYVNPSEAAPYDLGIVLNVKGAFYSQPNRLPPGKYKVDIALFSENCKTIRKSFVITWSGNWRNTEENMFKEVVVEELRLFSMPHF